MARAIVDEFVVGYRPQREWKWLILTAFFLGGVGGGVFLISALNGLTEGLILGLAVVIIGKGTAHLLFLGRPTRFWRMLASPGRSWVSRGIYIMAAFTVFGLLYTLQQLQHTPDSATSRVVQVLAIVSAVLLVTYTGFVMSYSPAIQFWSTPLLPALFGLYALSAGVAALFILRPLVNSSFEVKSLENLQMTLVIIAIILLAMYFLTMHYATGGAKEAVRRVTSSELSGVFWIGVVGVGLVLPLIGAVLAYSGGVSPSLIGPMMFVSALFELTGGFLMRYCLLRAGVFAPVF